MPTDEEIHYHMVKSKKLKFPEPRNEPNQYSQPIGPTRPSTLERITGAVGRVVDSPHVKGAVGAVKKRAGEIAHESRETPAQEHREHRKRRNKSNKELQDAAYNNEKRLWAKENRTSAPVRRHKRSPSRSPPSPPMGGGITTMNIDPFGVGGYGGMNSDPLGVRRNPAPRKRKSSMNMFGIPKGMEWMF
jgi:hypothetical protein